MVDERNIVPIEKGVGDDQRTVGDHGVDQGTVLQHRGPLAFVPHGGSLVRFGVPIADHAAHDVHRWALQFGGCVGNGTGYKGQVRRMKQIEYPIKVNLGYHLGYVRTAIHDVCSVCEIKVRSSV